MIVAEEFGGGLEGGKPPGMLGVTSALLRNLPR
jgi:hypothetical protein